MATSIGATTLAGLRRHQARIIAIPLSRPQIPTAITSSRGGPAALTYYQFQLASRIPSPSVQKPSKEAEDGAASRKKSWIPEEGVATWAQNKAAETWASFGRAKGGWQLKTYQFGERQVDKMDFEELALKSIDPSLGPSIRHPNSTSDPFDSDVHIPLHYPPSAVSGEDVVAELRQYVEHRIPVHKKGAMTWGIIAPFTAPFMIIPIIPNLPFFFCAWRSWSHYKAYKSSLYLQSLLDKNAIIPKPSETLDAIYKAHRAASPTPSPQITRLPRSTPITSDAEHEKLLEKEAEHVLLLDKTAVPVILEKFDLDKAAGAEMYRALEQARIRIGGKV